MDFSSANKIINEIYSDIDGFKISQEAIKKAPFYYIGMLYDEVTAESYFNILSLLPFTKNKIFIDLGSGVGKKVFLSSFCAEFSQSFGIEILPEVYEASMKALGKFNEIKNSLSKEIQDKQIEFYSMDFSKADLSVGDVFFMSMSKAGMEIELTGPLLYQLECCKKGTTVITTGLPFVSPYYVIKKHEKCDFSSGEGDVFFHERID